MARNGRVTTVVLGGLQLSADGDLANWSVAPGVGGVGGAMDLAAGSARVLVLMFHLTRDGTLQARRAVHLPADGSRLRLDRRHRPRRDRHRPRGLSTARGGAGCLRGRGPAGDGGPAACRRRRGGDEVLTRGPSSVIRPPGDDHRPRARHSMPHAIPCQVAVSATMASKRSGLETLESILPAKQGPARGLLPASDDRRSQGILEGAASPPHASPRGGDRSG